MGFLTQAATAHAQCAVCTVALVSGLGISRFLGVDDALTGVWLGAAMTAMMGFISNLLAQRFVKFKAAKNLSILIMASIFAFILYRVDGIVGGSNVLGLTNLSVGVVIGVICLGLGLYVDKALRQLKNDHGKAYFPFQKVVCPVAMVFLGTLFAWIWTL